MSTVVGLRDQALIGVVTYVGAAVAMRVDNYLANEKRWRWSRLLVPPRNWRLVPEALVIASSRSAAA
jgi:hypothetical protein